MEIEFTFINFKMEPIELAFVELGCEVFFCVEFSVAEVSFPEEILCSRRESVSTYAQMCTHRTRELLSHTFLVKAQGSRTQVAQDERSLCPKNSFLSHSHVFAFSRHNVHRDLLQTLHILAHRYRCRVSVLWLICLHLHREA